MIRAAHPKSPDPQPQNCTNPWNAKRLEYRNFSATTVFLFYRGLQVADAPKRFGDGA